MDAKACLGVKIHYETRFGTAACQPNRRHCAEIDGVDLRCEPSGAGFGRWHQAPATTAVPLVETISMVPLPVLMVS